MEGQEVLNRAGTNLHLCSASLSEMFNIHPEHPWDENQMTVLRSNTISFYRLSLHYMFVSEYSKLFVSVDPNKSYKNISSVKQALKAALERDNTLTSDFKENSKLLKRIENNLFSKKIIQLRNKQYAHSDGDISSPGTFIGLTLDEIETAFTLLRDIAGIINDCGKPIGWSMMMRIPDITNKQTQVFIRNHSKLFSNPQILITDYFITFTPTIKNSY